MWVIAGLAAVLLTVTVVVVAMLEPALPDDDVRRPARPVTGDDLRAVRLPLRWRGYDPATVDVMLAQAADAVDGARDAARAEADAALTAARTASSGEELEDAGADGAGGLDR